MGAVGISVAGVRSATAHPRLNQRFRWEQRQKDGYLKQSTTGTATVAGYVPATDASYYDAFGRRIAVSQTSQGNSGSSLNTTLVFAYDSSGDILLKRSGTVSGSTFTPFGGGSIDHYTDVNGQQISVLDEAGDITALGALTGLSDSSYAYINRRGQRHRASNALSLLLQCTGGDSDGIGAYRRSSG